MATEPWFWGTPEWKRYEVAYGRTVPHFGVDGNLVVRLASEAAMRARVSKGHRSDIRRAEAILSVEEGWLEDFQFYQTLHRVQHGKVRPKETFDLMRDFMREGFARLFLAYEKRSLGVIGAAYFYVRDGGSYYGSAARDVLLPRWPIGHAILWQAMRRFAQDGFEWLDLGPLEGPQASPKAIAVQQFKKGFGPELRRWPY